MSKRKHKIASRRALRVALKSTDVAWVRRGIHSTNWGDGVRKGDLGHSEPVTKENADAG
jgi:hypothetical protein